MTNTYYIVERYLRLVLFDHSFSNLKLNVLFNCTMFAATLFFN